MLNSGLSLLTVWDAATQRMLLSEIALLHPEVLSLILPVSKTHWPSKLDGLTT